MRTENQEKRRQEIQEAAYQVLREKGYKATSMLAIAKRASASNETLYRWYGNKQALFRAMVEDNAKTVRKHLQTSIENNTLPLKALKELGPLLLKLVTSEKAIALNRAAAADVHETDTLGKTIASGGKQTILPLIAELIQSAMRQGELMCDNAEDAANVYASLLISDLQIQRAIGVLPVPKAGEINTHASRTFEYFLRLFGCPT